MKIIKKTLTEEFAAGSAVNVARKMCGILGRRLGSTFSLFEIPTIFESPQGKYVSYYGVCKGKYNHIFTINFLRNKSDVITSFYLCDNKTFQPVEEINLNGFNIVEVLEQIVSVFDGSFNDNLLESTKFHHHHRFTEMIKIDDMVLSYLNDNPNYVSEINGKRFDYQKNLNIFTNYLKDKYNFNKTINVATFQRYIWHVFKITPQLKGNAAVVPNVTVNAPRVTKDEVLLSPEDQKIWDEISNITAKDHWNEFVNFVKLIVSGTKGCISLIAYGTAGTGKTYDTEKILKDEGVPFVKIGAPIADTKTIVANIFMHKDNEIILFDDIDSIFGSDNRANMFKQLLSQKEYGRMTGIKTNFKYRANDGVTYDIPPEFEVTSRIIVLSNKTRNFFDPAILSRVFTCELFFTKKEMMELIQEKLIYLGSTWSLTDDNKMYIFKLFERFFDKITTIDLRVFEKACQMYWIATTTFNTPEGPALDKLILRFIQSN